MHFLRPAVGEGWGEKRQRRRVVFFLFMALSALLVIDVAVMSLDAPAATYLVLDRQQRYLADIGGDEATGYGYWPLTALPSRVVAATLAIEDRRFWQHPGVDPLAIARAWRDNTRQGIRVSGASTLAMQLARMQHPVPRTYYHKLREAWRGMVLTLKFGRAAILENYLRRVPYGNNIHGIAYAARRYLDKPVADLSWAEIAFLSALPQAPTLMNPYREAGRQRAIERGLAILQRLRVQQILSFADYELSAVQLRQLRIAPLPARPPETLHAVLRLQDTLRTTPPRRNAEPYRLITTLDLAWQRRIHALTLETVAQFSAQGVENAAIILVDRATQGVLAWQGSTDYFDARHAGAIDYARVLRSPGSVLKPFFYAAALERGAIAVNTVLDDLPTVAAGIANADHRYLGPLLPRQALANSRNVPAANVLATLGIEEGYELLRDLGLHDEARPAHYYGLGLVTGALPATLETIMSAYTALADEGRWSPLQWYVGQPTPAAKRIYSVAVARTITLFLADPAARLPTFPRMGATEYAFPVALKTGTSSGLRDAWTIAYTPRYLLGVWLGNADARPMFEISGGSSAALLAQRVLSALHHDARSGTADLAFSSPPGYFPVSICARTGKRATAACDQVFPEWFMPGHEPQAEDDVYVRRAIDSHQRGLRVTSAPYRVLRTFVNLPARYAEWGMEHGLSSPPAEARASTTIETSPATPLRIVAPRDGAHVLRDPAVPAVLSTLALRAEVSPPVKEILWYIDDQPYALAPYPYTLRWRLTPGTHKIHAQVPASGEKTLPIRITVE